MKTADYPEPFLALVREFRRLPGVGPRSAERLALWMLDDAERSSSLARVLSAARDEVRHCADCGFFCLGERCDICEADDRESVLCVVERATDILPIERSRAFRGYYHSLGGRLSPLEHVGPEDLRLPVLEERVKSGKFEEVIFALSTDVEGEATTNYLLEVLKGFGVRMTRLAQGMPAGGGLEAADELTLARALSGRSVLGSV